MFPEVQEFGEIDSKLISNMWSDDMRFSHYIKIVEEIEKNINKYDTIIIGHGTDTMHYTGAALAFMLENLPIPVILVGAQRSSDRPSSDAKSNLLCALAFATKTNFRGVAIVMHSKSSDECHALNPLKVRKTHSSGRWAFQPINCQPLAKIKYPSLEIELTEEFQRYLSFQGTKFKAHKKLAPVGWVKFYPNFDPQILRAYLKYDGLILEGTGLGHLPLDDLDGQCPEHREIREILKQYKGIKFITTQTGEGRINLNVYNKGRLEQELGILGNYHDMTSECAYIKLAFVLANSKNPKEDMLKNLRGEMNERSTIPNLL